MTLIKMKEHLLCHVKYSFLVCRKCFATGLLKEKKKKKKKKKRRDKERKDFYQWNQMNYSLPFLDSILRRVHLN